MKLISLKVASCFCLVLNLLLVSTCSLPQEELPQEPDLTKELILQWNEVLEKERVEPSGLWIPFSPEANMDSLLKVWYGDATIIQE